MAREVTSKNIDGIADLVVIAPIKEGFINAYENITYATRLRIVAEALNRIRISAREHEFTVPFSDVTERILTLLDFRIGVLDKDLLALEKSAPKPGRHQTGKNPGLELQSRRYLYLTATFDTAWEPYMRLIWDPLGPFLDLVFSNCDGYVTAGDHTCEEFLDWVRANQMDSAIFYATTGNTIRDDIYHNKIERLIRSASVEDRELEILRHSLKHPDLDAQRVRERAFAELAHGKPEKYIKLNEQALEVLTVLYRLADYYPPEWMFTRPAGMAGPQLVEGKYLARVAYSILQGWDDSKLGEATVRAYQAPLEWYRRANQAQAGGKVPRLLDRPRAPDPALVRSEVQAGILEGFDAAAGRPVRHGALLLFTIRDAAAARKFLASVPVHYQGDPVPADGLIRTAAFTLDGLRRIEVRRETLEALPKEFREGMAERAGLIGDLRENHPRRWRLPERNWPPHGPADRPPVDLTEIDFVIQLRHAPAAGNESDEGPLLAEIRRLADLAEKSGAVLAAYEPMARLPAKPGPYGDFVDHFGFADGVSQPEIAPENTERLFSHEGEEAPGTADKPNLLFGMRASQAWNNKARLGEVLLGYRNDRQDFAPVDVDYPPGDPRYWAELDKRAARKLTRDGTFLVVRKLEQHVETFEQTLQDEARRLSSDPRLGITITPDQLAAKIVGRNRDGSPLIAAVDGSNDFDFVNDAQGSQCPFASHIRRTNPRTFEHGRPTPRIVRRGMSFGPPASLGEAETEPAAATPSTPPPPKRGLMFMCYQSSISEQFEVIQRWINGGNSTGVSSAQNDPLLGVGPKAGPEGYDSETAQPRLFQFEWQGKVVRAEFPAPFVSLCWGLYLFVPSRSALRAICNLRQPTGRRMRDVPDFPLPRENTGAHKIKQIASLPKNLQSFEWKRLLEDFDVKDPAERALSPDVWSAVRWYFGGSYRIKAGVSRDKSARLTATTSRFSFDSDITMPTVLTGSKAHALKVLEDWKNFSVQEQLARFEKASGAIYVAQQPDNDYEPESEVLPGIAGTYDYRAESEATNAVLMAYSVEQGFNAGYEAGRTVLAKVREAAMAIGRKHYKVELRRQYLTPAIGLVCTDWFGLPDWDPFSRDTESSPENAVMVNGPWNWNPANVALDPDNSQFRKPTCPGDCMSASRYAFYPRPTPAIEMFGIDQGQAIRRAGAAYVKRHVANNTTPPGVLIAEMFKLFRAGTITDEDVLARNLIGIMLGAIPPMEGSLRGIMLEWLGEKSIWRTQAAYLRQRESGRKPYDAAMDALQVPMTRAMCKRPAPDLLYRRATADVELPGRGGRRKTKVRRGDMVIVNLASAAQHSLHYDPAGKGDVSIIFGGIRECPYQGAYDDKAERAVEERRPVHACPGRNLAMGAMYGILAALLDEGRIEALPASLIIEVSDWRHRD